MGKNKSLEQLASKWYQDREIKDGNDNLNRSKRLKQDEFYTLYKTVESELKYHAKSFENKIVLLPCDRLDLMDDVFDHEDEKASQFWVYFKNNYHNLKLKGLIATGLHPKKEDAFVWRYDGENVSCEKLNGDGSFDSEEVKELMRNADIVVTNPPFSLIRNFIKVLEENAKDYLFIAPPHLFEKRDIFKGLFR